jgi:hypothetical protein
MVVVLDKSEQLTATCLPVVLFTLALFLSGYAIQQRTLRDLRRAIRPDPRPSPKIYLPDRFKKSTTELEDGSIIEIGDEDLIANDERQRKQQKEEVVIEIRPTVPEDTGAGAVQRPLAEEKADSRQEIDDKATGGRKEPESRAERRRRIKQEIQELSQGEGPMYYQRRLW